MVPKYHERTRNINDIRMGEMLLIEASSRDTAFLQEVGPRDGLQNEPRVLTPEVRADLIDRLGAAGLPRIQIGSFVNPRLVPQMTGTEDVWHRMEKKPGVRYSVLVLNRKGVQRAIDAGIPHVDIFVSASETHSLKNVRITASRALEEALAMIEFAFENGLSLTAGVMCAFGCFYEGAVSVDKVKEIVSALDRNDCTEIVLADTAGMADPASIKNTIEAVAAIVRCSAWPCICTIREDSAWQILSQLWKWEFVDLRPPFAAWEAAPSSREPPETFQPKRQFRPWRSGGC